MVHPAQKGAKCILAAFAIALIDVMGNIIGKAGQNAFNVHGIERGIIAFDQGHRGFTDIWHICSYLALAVCSDGIRSAQ